MLRKIRISIQLIFLFLFIYLIIENSYPLNVDSNFFIMLSPLSIFTMIAERQFIHPFFIALVILLLSFFLGRFFCGLICPLGTVIDISDRIFKFKANCSKKNSRVKYLILITFILLAFLGFSAAGLLDPLCIIQRTFSMVFYPYMNFLLNHVIEFSYNISFIKNYARDLNGFLIDHKVISTYQPLYSGHLLILLLFLIILFSGLKSRRFWCRNICPLGAMIGAVSGLSIYGRKVSDKCTMCNRCGVKCKMNAIEACKNTVKQECIECFDCLYLCPEDAISFKINLKDMLILKKNKTGESSCSGITRRDLIAGGVLTLLFLPALKLNYSAKKDYPFLLRPPGSLEEEKFVNLCVRCGTCMKACPTNGLQPFTFEGGLENLWTPGLVPRIGYCEYDCKLCSEVCPSGAIKQLSIEEKKKFKIGMAFINKDRCIPYRKGESCMVCEEMCPLPDKAIKYRTRMIKDGNGEKELKLPYVVEDLCIGCGICENKCPVRGMPAIYVTVAKNDGGDDYENG